MSQDIKRRVLVKALGISGGQEPLARTIGASLPDLKQWLDGTSEVPDEQLLKALDVCLDVEGPSLWADGEPGEDPPRLP